MDAKDTRHFKQSLYQAGVGLALIPVSLLPQRAQQHFKSAGHEFTRGVAKIVRSFAEELDEIGKEKK
jgi:hypothetical protein